MVETGCHLQREDVYAPASGWVYVAASLAPAAGPLTPFGALGIDLAQSAPIAIAAPQPSPSHDPHLLVQWPIPNSPTLVGFAMWLQAIAVPQSLPPRVTTPWPWSCSEPCSHPCSERRLRALVAAFDACCPRPG
ncbi:MAG: hypothetical protein H6835_20400 [Planctomycetes bacterium]|nr:hypothetical protein [Planctomycetota bacterium]